MAKQIQLRRDTQANWESVNPILADGECAINLDDDSYKTGDGITEWQYLESNKDYIATVAEIFEGEGISIYNREVAIKYGFGLQINVYGELEIDDYALSIDDWDEAYAQRGSQIAGTNLTWNAGTGKLDAAGDIDSTDYAIKQRMGAM